MQAGVDRAGVSVKGIKEGGVADKAGMMIGDELMEVCICAYCAKVV